MLALSALKPIIHIGRHMNISPRQNVFMWICFINPSLNQEGLNTYYSGYTLETGLKKKKMQQRELQYKIDANFLERFIDSGNLLDVGCNGGLFLNILSNSFDKVGIELDAEAVKFANENFDFKVVQGLLGER